MLTDKTMARLAEDCGWRQPEEESHRHKLWLSTGESYNAIMAHKKEGTWTLTDAGCWQASKKLLLNQCPLAGGKTWKVALPVGYPALSLADSTPEAALMLAIQEVYA